MFNYGESSSQDDVGSYDGQDVVVDGSIHLGEMVNPKIILMPSKSNYSLWVLRL